ncbi:hypothetical protein [Dysosmobacter sp. HCP28S3_G4]
MGILNSLTASVKKMEVGVPQSNSSGFQDDKKKTAWQAEAWEMYNTVGELSAVCQWIGSSAARVGLYAADVDPDTGRTNSPSDNRLARQIVRDIGGGAEGTAELLRHAATLLTVVGEFYIAIITDDNTGEEQWLVIPTNHVSKTIRGEWEIKLGEKKHIINDDTESLFKVWIKSPNEPTESRSSVRAALPVLREIRAMDRIIAAAARSRVSGNGILIVPAEAELPRRRPPRAADAPGLPPRPAMPTQEDDATSFSKSLYTTMKSAQDDPDSPAAVTPIVVKVPSEHAAQFRHLTLDTGIEAKAVDTRERAIRRLALSLDVPPEVLLGMGDSTHWNAGLVDESALRQHISPLVEVICDSLTESVLRPFMPEGEAGSVAVAADMSALAQKQDKSQAALDAFDRGVLSAAALRRELGFSEDDADDKDSDVARRALAERLVTKAPSLFPYLAEVLGFTLPQNVLDRPISSNVGAPLRAVTAGGDHGGA